MITATAEAADLPVLQYGHSYELFAGVTGQPTRWLAPRGSLPDSAPGPGSEAA